MVVPLYDVQNQGKVQIYMTRYLVLGIEGLGLDDSKKKKEILCFPNY